MSVYVDDMFAIYGRMKMCHMVADSSAELHAMAQKIGVARRWVQHEGKPSEHYDVCKEKRDRAIRLGALPISTRHVVNIVRLKREKIAPTDRDPHRLCCDECGDFSVLYGPVGLGEQHEGCGGFYRLIDLRSVA